MTPRRHLFVIAAAALALSGCGTLSDNDLVASVDDAELREDELQEILGGADLVPAEEARIRVREFVVVETLSADLEALGAEQPDLDTSGLPPGDALRVRQDAAIATWTSLDPSVLVDDEVRAFYESGPGNSGVACASHIVVTSRADAEAVLDELDAGADFAELATAVSIDPSSTSGGFIGCGMVESFDEAFGAETNPGCRSEAVSEQQGGEH